MFHNQRKDKNGNLLPFWHYAGMKGQPAWFSDIHKEISFDRFNRACLANGAHWNSMRYCCHCEVGIGVMDYDVYVYAYIIGRLPCPVCGKLAHEEPPDK